MNPENSTPQNPNRSADSGAGPTVATPTLSPAAAPPTTTTPAVFQDPAAKPVNEVPFTEPVPAPTAGPDQPASPLATEPPKSAGSKKAFVMLAGGAILLVALAAYFLL